jgi:hypothetical protein
MLVVTIQYVRQEGLHLVKSYLVMAHVALFCKCNLKNHEINNTACAVWVTEPEDFRIQSKNDNPSTTELVMDV